jgi:hypothetical protein
MVMNTPQVGSSAMSRPSNRKRSAPARNAAWQQQQQQQRQECLLEKQWYQRLQHLKIDELHLQSLLKWHLETCMQRCYPLLLYGHLPIKASHSAHAFCIKAQARKTHLQRQQLLCHHAEHLQPDAVELIKAGPCATLRKATEELGHELQAAAQ